MADWNIFVQDNGYLIPVRRGNLIADHPIWNIILEPGRVWQEEGDYFSDNQEFTWDAALRESDKIIPLCP